MRLSDRDAVPSALVGGKAKTDRLSEDEQADLFTNLRSGAANVAGVTFQIAVTGWLLASGRNWPKTDLDVVSVMPEGLEDIDCELRSHRKLLVQTKERGVEARAIGLAELTNIINHVAPALAIDMSANFAVITNGRFGNGIPTTGFSSTLADALATSGNGAMRTSLVEMLGKALVERAITVVDAAALLARTHLIIVDVDLAEVTLTLLEIGMKVHRAVASLVRAELLRDLSDLAGSQREATFASAGQRSLTELDALANRIQQAVNMDSLDEAVIAGVCEPADYLSRPSVDLVGFYAGVDVVPTHIAAGFDVLRREEATAVIDGLVARRDVTIAGPSGSGKSALLWRCAHLVLRDGARVLRILRARDDDDVELLIRHVRRQQPSEGARLLVVADDLGRDRMAAWPIARQRLFEIPGVFLLAAVRREDLTPGLSANSVVVDPRLTESAARSIYSAMEAAGVETAMAADEAVTRADGLLMEFIALVTTGRRLRDVLATQVESLRSDRIRREALRIVCACHLLGSAVSADALPTALGVLPDVAGDALARLAGEHLLIADGQFWYGLHDLRVETLFELLHVSPPPSMSATYASALALLPAAAQGIAARRAAIRIARRFTEPLGDATPAARLTLISDSLAPIATALRDILKALVAERGNQASTHAASLIEAADRLDTVAYVHAILPFLEAERKPPLSLAALSSLVYSAAVDGLTYPDPLEILNQLALRLPLRTSRCAEIVAPALTPAAIFGFARASDIDATIRLCEAAEELGGQIPVTNAREIYESIVGSLPNPGSGGPRLDADRRARLTATLAALTSVKASEVAALFGSVEVRAVDAVASDEFGCSVSLGLKPHQPASSQLERKYTYSDDEILVAEIRTFARSDNEIEPSAYPLQPGGRDGSVNEQAVLMARRLFDACPEVDQVNVEVWQANGEPIEPDGVKHLRAGVVPRPVKVARNVAFQAGVAEALGAENWTRRLRDQASVARDLVVLLEELPRRLERHDNTARRRRWVQRSSAAAAAVATLPCRPIDRLPVLGLYHDGALQPTAATADEELRRPDRAKAALEALAGALFQVAENLEDRQMVSHAGYQFAEIPLRLQEARQDGTPVFSGIGDTLPPRLETLSHMAARLLTALNLETINRALNSSKGDLDALEEALIEAADSAAHRDAGIVASFLLLRGVPSVIRVVASERPTPAWRQLEAVVICDVMQWETVVSLLQGWSADDRTKAGLEGRTNVVVAEDDELLPFGFGFFASGNVLPLQEENVLGIAGRISMPMRDQQFRTSIAAACEALVAYSYEKARSVYREPSWASPNAPASTPSEIEAGLRQDFAPLLTRLKIDDLREDETYRAEAIAFMLELCGMVREEAPALGIASQLASIDFKSLKPLNPDSSVALLNRVQVAALEVGRMPRP